MVLKQLGQVWHAIVLFGLSIAMLTYRGVRESKSKIHWVVFSLQPTPALTKLQDMSHTHGENINVLHADNTLTELSRFLQKPELAADDIVIYSDASSVVQVRSQKDIRSRFLTFSKPIIFGGQETLTDKSCTSMYGPLANIQPFPYVNPNVMVGRVWALRQLFTAARLEGDSQEKILTRLWTRNPSLVEIDSRGLLIVTHVKKSSISQLEWNPVQRCVTCRGTGTKPLIVQTQESVVPMYAFFGI
jgi:hypothetical protein